MFGLTADYTNGYSRGQADLRFWTNREIGELHRTIDQWRAYAQRVEAERDDANQRADIAIKGLESLADNHERLADNNARSTTTISQLRADFIRLSERSQEDSLRTNEMLVAYQLRLGELNQALTGLVAERSVLTQHINELLEVIQGLDPSGEIQTFRWQEIEHDRDAALAQQDVLASTVRRAIDALPSPRARPASAEPDDTPERSSP